MSKLSLEKRSSGTIYRQRAQQHWKPEKPFKILCIDGGGIKGILPASLFSLVEKNILGGEPIADYVDMICGTSTGGIIGLGLSLNKSADTIKDLYLNRGDEIFPRTLRLGVV